MEIIVGLGMAKLVDFVLMLDLYNFIAEIFHFRRALSVTLSFFPHPFRLKCDIFCTQQSMQCNATSVNRYVVQHQ